MLCVSSGATLERTEITPFPPIESIGTIISSLPEYMSISPCVSYMICAAIAISPVASFTPTILSTSFTSFAIVEDSNLQPVLLGTL